MLSAITYDESFARNQTVALAVAVLQPVRQRRRPLLGTSLLAPNFICDVVIGWSCSGDWQRPQPITGYDRLLSGIMRHRNVSYIVIINNNVTDISMAHDPWSNLGHTAQMHKKMQTNVKKPTYNGHSKKISGHTAARPRKNLGTWRMRKLVWTKFIL